MERYEFEVRKPDEPSAGLLGYTEEVTVTVVYGAGGESAEFKRYMGDCLAEWFDGAVVVGKLARVPTRFTVFGLYPESMQRHCEVVEARNPTEAEEVYRVQVGEHMLIAAVLAGEHTPIDSKDYGDE